MTEQDIILEVDQLEITFFTHSGLIHAVQGASFSVERGKVLGVVGESGCGKSVTAQAIMNMIPKPGQIVGGHIRYHPRPIDEQGSNAIDIVTLRPHGQPMRNIRGNEIAMIFQEPMTSLDPLYTVGNQLMEAIIEHHQVTSKEARQRAVDALSRVKLPEPHRLIDSYPHELSGGMRQRVMIAIGLSCNPRLLIADEPTMALDVTTQAEILELMRELQEDSGMSIIFITHDLGVIAEMCDEVAVMYLGKVVEKTDVDFGLLRSEASIYKGAVEVDPQD